MPRDVHFHIPEEQRTEYRNVWETSLAPSVLKELAQNRVDYHGGRVKYWTGERDKAHDAYKESIEIRSHEVTGGRQMHVTGDPDMAAHLSTCESKLSSHRSKLREFQTWVDFFEAHTEASRERLPAFQTISVTVADLRYFQMPDEVDE